ncbi:MAG: starch-binding protein [Opitutales bacterium]|nr:starch-binding protein [Opitutales bacterium]
MKHHYIPGMALFALCCLGSPSNASAQEAALLPADSSDGVILHAWNWSFDAIRAKLPQIAAAGYKTVQTSPIQPNKEALIGGGYWWILYQPTDFTIGNTQLGDRAAFAALCAEAEDYEVDIIVDVVANHTGNNGSGLQQYYPSTAVAAYLRDNAAYWHEHEPVADWNDRWEVTHHCIGLPDLNTANSEIQGYVSSFLNDAIDCGADGFRFDTAKHIELPDDDDGSDFWPNVLGSLSRSDLFIYGEVLQDGTTDRFSDYAAIMRVTASWYGYNVLDAVGFEGSADSTSAKSLDSEGVSADRLVTWVESHDTYANTAEESTALSDTQIRLAWAIVASRADCVPLFFNRPAGTAKFATTLGTEGDSMWQDADVVAANTFHNAMAGKSENLRTPSSTLFIVERGCDGTAIVNLSSSAAAVGCPSNLPDGSYVSSGSGAETFTVSAGNISGTIAAQSVAFLSNELDTPEIYIDAEEGTFYSSAIVVTVNATGADSITCSIDGGGSFAVESGQGLSIGEGLPLGGDTVLSVTATNGSGSITRHFGFSKADIDTVLTVHYRKPDAWGVPNVYCYDDSSGSSVEFSAWPGEPMEDEGDGWYVFRFDGWNEGKVLFNSGSSQEPASSQPGYELGGEVWVYDGNVYDWWYDSTWYGNYYYGHLFSGWIWHEQHGWQYLFDMGADRLFAWDWATASWWYTDACVYPAIYNYKSSSWYYFEGGSSPEREFWDYAQDHAVTEGELP